MIDKINFVVYQGADFRRLLEFKDESGALLNLEGSEFRGQVRHKHGTPVVLEIIFTIRDQLTQKGRVDLHITSASTEVLNLTKEIEHIYDIEMVDISGEVRRVMEGKIKIFPEVTK